MKTCTNCKVEQPLREFYTSTYTKSGYQFWCRTCFTKKSIAYQKADPQRTRRFWLKHRYGITPEEEYRLLVSQDFLCGICKCELEFARPHIDHNKATGQIRGILCSRCNQGFGLFAENVEYLAAAIEYKIKWSTA